MNKKMDIEQLKCILVCMTFDEISWDYIDAKDQFSKLKAHVDKYVDFMLLEGFLNEEKIEVKK